VLSISCCIASGGPAESAASHLELGFAMQLSSERGCELPHAGFTAFHDFFWQAKVSSLHGCLTTFASEVAEAMVIIYVHCMLAPIERRGVHA
jgi:hypothetical protein